MRIVRAEIYVVFLFFTALLVGSVTLAASSCPKLFESIAIQKIKSPEQVLSYISEHLDEAKTDRVIKRFVAIFEETVGIENKQTMSERQFYELFSKLKILANEYNIRIEP